MKNEEQRLLTGRQVQARRTWTLTPGAIGLSVLLGMVGGIAAVLLFTSGVTRRVGQLERNAERLAGGQPLLPTTAAGDVLGELGRGLERAGSCSASASRSCARPRPCWSTSWSGARW
jgi:hypothetical protein